MNLVNILEKAIKDKDWNLISKALHLINGQSNVVVNNPVLNKIETNKKTTFQNKFVDDLSIEPNLIEKNPVRKEKSYRRPFSESDHYVNVKCSSCNTETKIPTEEYKFRKMDSESSGFTCIKCIRKIR